MPNQLIFMNFVYIFLLFQIVSSSSSISNISNEDSVYPPQLQYPEDPQWNVFVMSANSTVEIWLRIIGEQYSVCKLLLCLFYFVSFFKCQ